MGPRKEQSAEPMGPAAAGGAARQEPWPRVEDSNHSQLRIQGGRHGGAKLSAPAGCPVDIGGGRWVDAAPGGHALKGQSRAEKRGVQQSYGAIPTSPAARTSRQALLRGREAQREKGSPTSPSVAHLLRSWLCRGMTTRMFQHFCVQTPAMESTLAFLCAHRCVLAIRQKTHLFNNINKLTQNSNWFCQPSSSFSSDSRCFIISHCSVWIKGPRETCLSALSSPQLAELRAPCSPQLHLPLPGPGDSPGPASPSSVPFSPLQLSQSCLKAGFWCGRP